MSNPTSNEMAAAHAIGVQFLEGGVGIVPRAFDEEICKSVSRVKLLQKAAAARAVTTKPICWTAIHGAHKTGAAPNSPALEKAPETVRA